MNNGTSEGVGGGGREVWDEKGRVGDKKRVLSRIDAIEPRIIHASGQNPAIFERGIGERNYTF